MQARGMLAKGHLGLWEENWKCPTCRFHLSYSERQQHQATPRLVGKSQHIVGSDGQVATRSEWAQAQVIQG